LIELTEFEQSDAILATATKIAAQWNVTVLSVYRRTKWLQISCGA